MANCSVYKTPNLLGTGAITNDATQITSFTAETGVVIGTGRNIQVMITSSTDAGKVFPARVISDNGTTLDLGQNNPFAT